MKICIISNSHHTNDVRLYYKIARSLAKTANVYLICADGVRQESVNPKQIVVDSESGRKALRPLYSRAKRLKPDLVICVEPLTLLVGIYLQKRIGCKVIVDLHEFFADAFAERFSISTRWLMKLFYLVAQRWLLGKIDGAIAVNEQILDQALPARLKAKSIVIPNYPVKNVWDSHRETPVEISMLTELNFDMVYIGGLTHSRGVFKILKAASRLRTKIPRLKILIIGKFHNAEVEKEFTNIVDRYNLSGTIYYQRWIAADKIGLLLKRCRVGLWIFDPRNRRMRRALPLKILEYYAAGLPVVSTKTPLMKALVAKNEVGELCEYTSRNIADAMHKVLSLPKDEYSAMSQRAIDLVNTRYNWEILEPKLLKYIEKVITT